MLVDDIKAYDSSMTHDTSRSSLHGIYRGKVIQHLTHGYCKIFIYGIYPDVWERMPDMLPRAEQASPLFAGTNEGNGVFTYPNIGSMVWCMFANGDQNLPIYFAAALAGQNAYGQHQLVFDPKKEEESRKHLVTSGKSRVEIYESGKISAVVEDPIRTEAAVDYSQLSGELSSRPVQDAVDLEQISNMNCQLVLDNAFGNGTISCSTHRYVPIDQSLNVTTSSETNPNAITSITDSTKSVERVDCKHVLDNQLLNSYDAMSAYVGMSSKNVTKSLEQSTEQTNDKSNIVVSSKHVFDAANNYGAVVGHTRQVSHAYKKKSPIEDVTTSKKVSDYYNAGLQVTEDACVGFNVLSSASLNISIKNAQDSVQTIVETSLDNKLQVNSEDGILIQAKHDIMKLGSSGTMTKQNEVKFTGSNSNTAEVKLNASGFKTSGGTPSTDAKYALEMSTSLGTLKHSFNDNVKNVDYSKDISTKRGTSSEVYDDKDRGVKVSCQSNTASGNLEIMIKDKMGGTFSKMLLDKAGNITIESSVKITLKAPNIEIDGITHVTGATTIDSPTMVKSTLTTIGDTTVAGSSYTGHTHQYILPTYPAGPSQTSTRIS